MARPKGSSDKRKRKPRRCYKTEKLVGTKFERLFIHEIVSVGKQPKIRVTCECGTEKIISPYDLTKRNVKSCGCYQREITSKRQIKPDNQSAKRRLFNNYRLSAKTRKHVFELSELQVFEITTKNCYYCDKAPFSIIKTVGGQITVNGIDRVDNSIGYIPSNCVPCCGDCNWNKKEVNVRIILKAAEFLKCTISN